MTPVTELAFPGFGLSLDGHPGAGLARESRLACNSSARDSMTKTQRVSLSESACRTARGKALQPNQWRC